MKLDNCPFCGTSQVELDSSTIPTVPEEERCATEWVQCQNDDCGATGPIRCTVDEAVAAWNKRTQLEEDIWCFCGVNLSNFETCV